MKKSFSLLAKNDILSVWFKTPEGTGGETLFCKFIGYTKLNGNKVLRLRFSYNPSPSMKIWQNGEMVSLLKILQDKYYLQDILISEAEYQERVTNSYNHEAWTDYLKNIYNIELAPQRWYTPISEWFDYSIAEIGKYLKTSQHW